MIAGSLAIGPILDSYGRKSGLTIALLLAAIGWSVLFGGGWMVLGRLLTGLSAGLSSAPVSVLIAEISAPKVRAVVSTFKQAAFSLGLFLMYCLKLLFQERWEKSALSSAGIAVCCLVLVYFWVPEASLESRPRRSYLPFLRALTTRPDVRGPFLVMSTISAFKQLSGTTVVLSYALHMIGESGSTQTVYGALYLGGVRLAASLLAAPLAGKLGRRPLACYAGFISSLALIFLASNTDHPLPLLLTFVFTSALASSAIQALVGEVYLPEFRAVSTGLTTTAIYSSAFLAIHLYPWLLSWLGFLRLLSVYAVISVLSTLLTICLLKDNLTRLPENQVLPRADSETAIPLKDMTKNEDCLKV